MTQRNAEGEFFTISVVAEMFDITPQTLRLYESHGLIHPSRTEGGTRMYTRDDVQRLETICHLINDLGVNIAGVEVILKMMENYQTREQELRTAFQRLIVKVQEEFHNVHRPSETALVRRVRSQSLHLVRTESKNNHE